MYSILFLFVDIGSFYLPGFQCHLQYRNSTEYVGCGPTSVFSGVSGLPFSPWSTSVYTCLSWWSWQMSQARKLSENHITAFLLIIRKTSKKRGVAFPCPHNADSLQIPRINSEVWKMLNINFKMETINTTLLRLVRTKPVLRLALLLEHISLHNNNKCVTLVRIRWENNCPIWLSFLINSKLNCSRVERMNSSTSIYFVPKPQW